ncbi:hypothetical protein [Aliiglaciecola litoralis]|uniref:hypothetical protein n=1 Tax=Aliiglaciecola litoralis TaxID=582857 RepID=UPI0031DA46FC
MLLIAALILVLIAVAHSYLGERYILMRLFRRDNIPYLFGSDHFTKGTLRFCWHTMSVAALGFAAILFNHSAEDAFNLYVIGTVFLIGALLSIFYTRGMHLSWIAFLVVSGICFFEAWRV